MSRIVLTTFGSFGDLHPYIALALDLKSRGHDPTIATCEYYRAKIEALGLGFHGIRPDLPDPAVNAELIRQVMDLHTGTETVVRQVVMPALRGSYADLADAIAGADLLVSHPLTYAARLLAEKTGIRWISSVLQPIGFFSAYDPPVPPTAPFLHNLAFVGADFNTLLLRFLKWTVRDWSQPWHDLRTELGLPPTSDNPLFEGQYSPTLHLALFSELLAAKQPDSPSQTVITGFPFYDESGAELPPNLTHFLDSGTPPIVFTLGTSAVMNAGDFYEQSVAAVNQLGQRAVLLVGKDPRNLPAHLPENIVALDYAPYSDLFSRAAVIVHQGGIGTTAQAMRSGRPMLVVPYSHDQPDNAMRVTRLGIARTLYRSQYTLPQTAQEMRALLNQPSYARQAAIVGEKIRQEDGVKTACDQIEKTLLSLQTAN